MNKTKAIFIDCDGVLYDKQYCTYEDIAVVALEKTLAKYNIPYSEFQTKRIELRNKGVHGLINTILKLCQSKGIPFGEFSKEMVKNTDYSRIPKDTEMLKLLQQAGTVKAIYIVTNNTRPHLEKVLSCLKGEDTPVEFSKLNVYPITIEETLYDGMFHPKKVTGQFKDLCAAVGEKPQNVLMLDDTQEVCDAAINQGVKTFLIQCPGDTKTILKGVINEKSKPKRHFSLWQTCGKSRP